MTYENSCYEKKQFTKAKLKWYQCIYIPTKYLARVLNLFERLKISMKATVPTLTATQTIKRMSRGKQLTKKEKCSFSLRRRNNEQLRYFEEHLNGIKFNLKFYRYQARYGNNEGTRNKLKRLLLHSDFWWYKRQMWEPHLLYWKGNSFCSTKNVNCSKQFLHTSI